MWHAPLLAEIVQQRAPLHAGGSLEGAGGIVDSSMDDLGIAGTRALADGAVLLDEEDVPCGASSSQASCEVPCDGQTDDASADDDGMHVGGCGGGEVAGTAETHHQRQAPGVIDLCVVGTKVSLSAAMLLRSRRYRVQRTRARVVARLAFALQNHNK